MLNCQPAVCLCPTPHSYPHTPGAYKPRQEPQIYLPGMTQKSHQLMIPPFDELFGTTTRHETTPSEAPWVWGRHDLLLWPWLHQLQTDPNHQHGGDVSQSKGAAHGEVQSDRRHLSNQQRTHEVQHPAPAQSWLRPLPYKVEPCPEWQTSSWNVDSPPPYAIDHPSFQQRTSQLSPPVVPNPTQQCQRPQVAQQSQQRSWSPATVDQNTPASSHTPATLCGPHSPARVSSEWTHPRSNNRPCPTTHPMALHDYHSKAMRASSAHRAWRLPGSGTPHSHQKREAAVELLRHPFPPPEVEDLDHALNSVYVKSQPVETWKQTVKTSLQQSCPQCT